MQSANWSIKSSNKTNFIFLDKSIGQEIDDDQVRFLSFLRQENSVELSTSKETQSKLVSQEEQNWILSFVANFVLKSSISSDRFVFSRSTKNHRQSINEKVLFVWWTLQLFSSTRQSFSRPTSGIDVEIANSALDRQETRQEHFVFSQSVAQFRSSVQIDSRTMKKHVSGALELVFFSLNKLQSPRKRAKLSFI